MIFTMIISCSKCARNVNFRTPLMACRIAIRCDWP